MGNTLYVGGVGPNNYSSIQAAINDADDGYTVFVYNYSSPYYEHIIIDKSINVVGANKFNTVIDIENHADDAVVITADNVVFQGFTVTNARNKDEIFWDQSGIEIYSSNVTIKDNIISDNRLGLLSYTTAFNLTICDKVYR